MTLRDQIITEYHRLCTIVNEAEEADLLDMDQALAMRQRYRERADAVLDVYRKAERKGVPLDTL
jgi:hypothetical protein